GIRPFARARIRSFAGTRILSFAGTRILSFAGTRILSLASAGIQPFARARVPEFAGAALEPLARPEIAPLARPNRLPLARANVEHLAGPEIAQLARAEQVELGRSAEPHFAPSAPETLTGSEGLFRAARRSGQSALHAHRDAARGGPRVAHFPDCQDLPLSSRVEPADDDVPWPVNDVGPALDGADRHRAVIVLLDVAWRLDREGKRTGFPGGPDHRPFPRERPLAHPSAPL